MKLTKKLLLLQFSVMLIFIFSACNYESGVMKTLPKYSGCEKYSYGARDFVDYHKYYYVNNNDISESIKSNDNFQKVTNENTDSIKNCIEYFSGSINNSTDDMRNNYDFLENQINVDDYFCFISKDKSNPLNNFNLYYFDKETQILYYFHSDV